MFYPFHLLKSCHLFIVQVATALINYLYYSSLQASKVQLSSEPQRTPQQHISVHYRIGASSLLSVTNSSGVFIQIKNNSLG